jgi:hypothetical protein
MSATLPDGFDFLEPFAATWGELRTQNERYIMRQSLPYADLAAFHAALAPRLEETFAYLDGFHGAELGAAEARLYRTVLGLTEVAHAVETYGESRIPHAPFPHSVPMNWAGYDPS